MQATMCQAPPRGCILAGPEMEKHVSGACYACACLRMPACCWGWPAWLVWLGCSQQASAKVAARLLDDSMRSSTKRRV